MLLERFDKEPGYNPDNLLDQMKITLNARTDSALARALRVDPPIISKVRCKRAPVTAALFLRCVEISQMKPSTLRRWLGVKQI